MPTHRIASRNSPNRHDTAADNPVLRDRIARIHRATRLESARRPIHRMNHRRDRCAIDRNRADGEQSLMRQTENLIRRYLPLVDEAPNSQIRIDVFWIVSQRAGTPSPVHFHSCDISGVLYLKLPQLDREDEEAQKTYISGRQAGYINFLIGGKQRFSKSLVSFRPRVGDFYIFPGWLLHGAEPFRGTGERRSLAFNAYVDAAEG